LYRYATGDPKGVMLTHLNLISNCAAYAEDLNLNRDDAHISYLPLAHIYERVTMLVCLFAGAKAGFFRGDVLGRVGTFHRVILQAKHIRLTTAGVVHVNTNLTPGSERNPSAGSAGRHRGAQAHGVLLGAAAVEPHLRQGAGGDPRRASA
jgi:acyl-CoA synthetase (AMP-forming)/AMP-acid ligase II